ncbi:MAG TPA: hypothetical protein VN999_13205 [Thermoanaerobaculia bacterium]|nr:hypothetical protein [Thermoanaerobaculia bacterium]
MAATHPITIHFAGGATDCKLKLLEGAGTWGAFSDNNVLTMQIDEPPVAVTIVEAQFAPSQGKGLTSVNVVVPGAEAISVTVVPQEVAIAFAGWEGDSATFTLHFNSGDRIFFDAFLSRTSVQGTVSVSSPDGDETDYLLPNQDKRRVTLPLKPPPGSC